jgi:nitronate monooxygenase
LDGTLGYRCPGEPEANYIAKGGMLADTIGRKCVCNGLVSTIGLGQVLPEGDLEPALVTAGDDALWLARFLPANGNSYSAADVTRCLLRSDPN